MRIRQILFPTNLSESDRRASRFASLLARHRDVALHVLNVPVIYFPFLFGMLTRSACDELMDQHKLSWESRAHTLLQEPEFRGLSIQPTVRGVIVREQILEAAERSDLIVMGSRPRSCLARMIVGSVAECIVGRARCPVIVVRRLPGNDRAFRREISRRFRKDTAELHLRNLLVPLDGSAVSESVLPIVMELARLLKLRITLLRVITPCHRISVGRATERANNRWPEIDAYLQGKKQMLEDGGFVVGTMIRAGDPAEQILNYAEEKEIDLIAIGIHARNPPHIRSLGGVAKRILRTSPVPTLYSAFAENG